MSFTHGKLYADLNLCGACEPTSFLPTLALALAPAPALARTSTSLSLSSSSLSLSLYSLLSPARMWSGANGTMIKGVMPAVAASVANASSVEVVNRAASHRTVSENGNGARATNRQL